MCSSSFPGRIGWPATWNYAAPSTGILSTSQGYRGGWLLEAALAPLGPFLFGLLLCFLAGGGSEPTIPSLTTTPSVVGLISGRPSGCCCWVEAAYGGVSCEDRMKRDFLHSALGRFGSGKSGSIKSSPHS